MAENEGSVVGRSPPPRKTDVLFGPGTHSPTNACVNYGEGEGAYSRGFRHAAQLLAAQVCETGREQDTLIYPIVYLYRHTIEMALKFIIEDACELLDRTLNKKELDTIGRHDLDKLWKLAKPLLNPVCERVGNPAFPPDDLEGISSHIRQLHEHDPDGQRFRYAKTKGRRPSLKPGLRNINILDFATYLERLADYLDAVVSWFGHLAGEKAEMQAEYARGEW